MNFAAARKGYEAAREKRIDHSLEFNGTEEGRVGMSGARAAALGALAADCRFFPFYPMSPGTPIITHLASLANKVPIVVEQAEDEIAADLLFAIHASQDEFPRFIFAPGSALSIFHAVKKAGMLADKFQVPAIVLMDQFLVDSAMTEPKEFDLGNAHKSFFQTDPIKKEAQVSHSETYQRYRFTKGGIFSRIHPFTGAGLVRVADNEHTEAGVPSQLPRPDGRSL